MNPVRFTLCGEGSSDEALMPIIDWVIRQHLPDTLVDGNFAPWYRLPARNPGLADKLRRSLALFECDLLVVHRDADRDGRQTRVEEIRRSVEELCADEFVVPAHVCVIPVRMTETWLMIDEAAVRAAAANRNGQMKLPLPPLRRLESVADPKGALAESLRIASGLKGRRLKTFETSGRGVQVAGHISNYTPLRHLAAFRAFEAEVEQFSRDWLNDQR